MPKFPISGDAPGAVIPSSHKLHTIDDVTELTSSGTFQGSFPGPQCCCELIINVATAGNVRLEMHGDAAATTCDYTLPVGIYFIPGYWRKVFSTGTTAVLSPANTVVARFLR